MSVINVCQSSTVFFFFFFGGGAQAVTSLAKRDPFPLSLVSFLTKDESCFKTAFGHKTSRPVFRIFCPVLDPAVSPRVSEGLAALSCHGFQAFPGDRGNIHF